MTLAQLDKSKGIGIHTDGSAWAQDRSGGWAWIAIDCFSGECQDSGRVTDTTNNRMEMVAWIEGLNAVWQALGPCEIIMFSDSQYVGLGAMDRGRVRVKNKDLWAQIDAAIDRHTYVEFTHIKGHNGNSYNERVDKLATKHAVALAPLHNFMSSMQSPLRVASLS